MTNWDEIGTEVDHVYRPYLWLGEEQDNHVQWFKLDKERHSFEGAIGGGRHWLNAMQDIASQQIALQHIQNDPYATRTAYAMQNASLQNSWSNLWRNGT